MRSQLRLALRVLACGASGSAVLPLLFLAVPDTGPLAITCSGCPALVPARRASSIPALIAARLLYVRQAERNERDLQPTLVHQR